jgi:hypothetical protein
MSSVLNWVGRATLLFDLLTPQEEQTMARGTSPAFGAVSATPIRRRDHLAGN